MILSVLLESISDSFNIEIRFKWFSSPFLKIKPKSTKNVPNPAKSSKTYILDPIAILGSQDPSGAVRAFAYYCCEDTMEQQIGMPNLNILQLLPFIILPTTNYGKTISVLVLNSIKFQKSSGSFNNRALMDKFHGLDQVIYHVWSLVQTKTGAVVKWIKKHFKPRSTIELAIRGQKFGC